MFSKLILICLGIVLAYFIRYRRKRARLYKLMDQFDGPPGIPILGNVFDFKSDPAKRFEHLRKNYLTKFKDTFKIWLLHYPIVIIFKPEDIRILSTKNLEKDPAYQFLTELLADGLISCSMEKWRRRRPIVNPAFQMPYLIRNVLGIFQQHFLELSNILEKECDLGREFDLLPYEVKTNFGVICEVLMGYSNTADSTEIERFSEALDKSIILVSKRVLKPWLYPSFMYSIYKYLTGQSGIIEEAKSLPQKVLENRKQGLRPHKTDSEGNVINSLIDIIGGAKGNPQYLEDQEIIDVVLSIFFAGAEGPAIISSFNMLMLAIKPEIQEKVINELDEIFGDSDRLPTADDLDKMIYLEQCIKETQRWVSTIPVITRTSSEEIELSDGRIIPVGARIAIVSYMTHHDENIYPDPNTWNPDNFLAENINHRHPYSYIPFGFGLRMCLGPKYMMLAIKVLQSTILRKYKLRTSLKEEDVKFTLDFMIRSANGYPVQLEYRKSKS